MESCIANEVTAYNCWGRSRLWRRCSPPLPLPRPRVAGGWVLRKESKAYIESEREGTAAVAAAEGREREHQGRS